VTYAFPKVLLLDTIVSTAYRVIVNS